MSMMYTHSAARALLTNRYAYSFTMCSGDAQLYLLMAARVTTHIGIPLSDDVLLEIFDAYDKSMNSSLIMYASFFFAFSCTFSHTKG